jgi:hypothetical protein
MQRKQLVTSKFGLNVRRGSDSMTIRTVIVDVDDTEMGTNAFEEQVRLACVRANQAEQSVLEKESAEACSQHEARSERGSDESTHQTLE